MRAEDARLLAAQEGADVDGSARVRNDAERPVSAHQAHDPTCVHGGRRPTPVRVEQEHDRSSRGDEGDGAVGVFLSVEGTSTEEGDRRTRALVVQQACSATRRHDCPRTGLDGVPVIGQRCESEVETRGTTETRSRRRSPVARSLRLLGRLGRRRFRLVGSRVRVTWFSSFSGQIPPSSMVQRSSRCHPVGFALIRAQVRHDRHAVTVATARSVRSSPSPRKSTEMPGCARICRLNVTKGSSAVGDAARAGRGQHSRRPA